MNKKLMLWIFAGYLVGSYFGLSHLMAMFGAKKG